MSREKQLVKNTVIVAIGKICTQFISFFLLPLYTALLTTEEYGTVDLLNTYVSLLIPVIFFQIDQAIFRYLIDERKNINEEKKLISTTFFVILIQALLFLIMYMFICIFIRNEYKYFLGLIVIVSMFSNVMLQISRGIGDNTTYSEGSLVSGVGTIVLNVIFIWLLKLGAYGMLSATLIANLLCGLFVFFKKKVYQFISIKNFDKNYLKKLWKYSIPLIPNQLSWWVINASDRIIVTYFLGVSLNGIYSAANKFSSICISLFGIFNMTWSESASMYIKDKDSSCYFTNIINTSIKLFSCISIGITSIMPFAFKYLITGKSYVPAYNQIPILMLSTLFSIVVSLLGSIYVALKKSNEIAKTSFYSALINIVVNLSLIKFIGLYAASISTLFAYLAMSIYRYIDVQKYVKIKLDENFILLFIPVNFFVVVTYYIKNFYLCLFALILVSVFSIITNKNIIASIFKMILHMKGKISKDNKISTKDNSLDTISIPTIKSDNIISSNSINEKESILPKEDIIPKEEIYTDRASLSNAIRNNNSYIRNIDFNYNYNFNIVDLILEEIKIYNYKFNNEDYLRNGKYPTILSNNHSFMKYVIDKDFNNIFYIDSINMDKNEVNGIINYTFKKVYFLKEKDSNIKFNLDKFNHSDIVNNNYFIECLKYIK